MKNYGHPGNIFVIDINHCSCFQVYLKFYYVVDGHLYYEYFLKTFFATIVLRIHLQNSRPS